MRPALFAIGGAVQLDGSVLRTFYERSGGPAGQIIILPTASALPEAGQEYREAFSQFGLQEPARILNVRQREDADQAAICEAMRAATGIFMTGGNQMRLAAILGGTQVQRELLAAYQRGTVVGGTSAGSAALSTVMIAFGSSGAFPRHRIAQFAPGLGLEPGIIFDQHFRQRNRLGRLMYAVAINPGMLGVGVDENTAAIIEDHQLSVIGKHGVTIVDGTGITGSNVSEVNHGDMIAISGIRLHVLNEGSRFDLQSRVAHLAPAVLTSGE